VEIRNYLRDQAGSRSLVLDLSIAHDRYGSGSHPLQNGRLTHPQDIDAPLLIAAQRKINIYTCHHKHVHPHARRIFASSFLQAHRETEAHFTATGMQSQRNQSDSFRFKRAAFYQSLTSKVGRLCVELP
jgi:hypothetical protein